MKQIIWHHHIDDKQRALDAYEKAFKNSGCQECPGLCCKTCAEHDGHLHKSGVSKNKIIAMKFEYGWDKDLGFQSDKGCKIPLEERSLVCVGFHCGGGVSKFMQHTKTPGNTLPEDRLVALREQLAPFYSLLKELQNA